MDEPHKAWLVREKVSQRKFEFGSDGLTVASKMKNVQETESM